jgi:hypothetical protein
MIFSSFWGKNVTFTLLGILVSFSHCRAPLRLLFVSQGLSSLSILSFPLFPLTLSFFYSLLL